MPYRHLCYFVMLLLHLAGATLAEAEEVLLAIDRRGVVTTQSAGRKEVLLTFEPAANDLMVLSEDGAHLAVLDSANAMRSARIAAGARPPANTAGTIRPSLARKFGKPGTAVFSPDATHIALLSEDERTVWIECAEAGEATAIASTTEGFFVGPWWSRDGVHVVYFAAHERNSIRTGGYILKSYDRRTQKIVDLAPRRNPRQ